ncbi:MAG: hypothetical protein PHR20_02955 [Bacteroidales bacterium]|nr:hypothetical protein [Bacteroidales bacterium]
MDIRRHISAIFVLCCLLVTSAYSQSHEEQSKANILYSRERLGFITVNTHGFGAGFRQSYIRSVFRTDDFEINFSTYRDPKEESGYNYQGFRSYKYGKLNDIILLRALYGSQYNIARKPQSGGVEIQLCYGGGLTLCFAQPVYLYVAVPDSIGTGYYAEVQKYDPTTHSEVDILGKGPMFYGILETKIYPGLYGNIGVNFEFGEYNNRAKSVQLGIDVDIFPMGVPVMAYNDPKNFIFSFYLNVLFGKRYNK